MMEGFRLVTCKLCVKSIDIYTFYMSISKRFRMRSPYFMNSNGLGEMANVIKAKTLHPQPYPSFRNKEGANSGTVPPTMDRNTAPAAIADAAYFSNASM